MIKALLNREWRNQDIQDLLNRGRSATVNSARITEVKTDSSIKPASDNDLNFFIKRKKSYDLITGLNKYDDERLIRAREAMILGVQNFNNPSLKFKTEQFAVQAIIAWTYLLHEYYLRQNVNIKNKRGHNFSLADMIRRGDCPVSPIIKKNIKAVIDIRNDVTHGLLQTADKHFFTIFQAYCLNFDKTICAAFGDKVSLQNELSLALQFSKLDFNQLVVAQSYELPENIKALDARLNKNITETEKEDLEYQFQVIYTLAKANKSKAHIQFVKPDSDEGREIHNVLEKHILADKFYPYRPSEAVEKIAQKSGMPFNVYQHTNAWKQYKARPESNSLDPSNTKKEWCVYHPVHKDYTYSDKWVDFVADKLSNNAL